MVKRDDRFETSAGRVRDTEREPVEPDRGCESEGNRDLPAAYYRPEMGTVIVTNHPRDDS